MARNPFSIFSFSFSVSSRLAGGGEEEDEGDEEPMGLIAVAVVEAGDGLRPKHIAVGGVYGRWRMGNGLRRGRWEMTVGLLTGRIDGIGHSTVVVV